MLSFVCKKVPFVTRCERSTGLGKNGKDMRRREEGGAENRRQTDEKTKRTAWGGSWWSKGRKDNMDSESNSDCSASAAVIFRLEEETLEKRFHNWSSYSL